MSFLPQGNLTLQVTDIPSSSKTYKLDFENRRIVGFVDRQDAVKQFILKALITERFKYLIYDNQYGSELVTIVNQDYPEELIESLAEMEIREALQVDSRILDVDNFKIEFLPKAVVNVSFEVNTIFGTIPIENFGIQ